MGQSVLRKSHKKISWPSVSQRQIIALPIQVDSRVSKSLDSFFDIIVIFKKKELELLLLAADTVDCRSA